MKNFNIDFIVEIPEGKKPLILQLSDPQLLDSSQAASGRLSKGEDTYWARDKKDERCFRHIRETVSKTSPDLILVAGDIVYGEFDHDGSGLCSFVEFMESFGIPWAPVLGNHETESRMGVDWQCEQLHNAKNCLFKQRTLTGNGNYTVGIKQNGKLIRVFYMMDSNSGNPSELSLANGHSKHEAGFGDDQIEWYTEGIRNLRCSYPDVKISFVFHIALHAFEDAYAKYGYTRDRSSKVFPMVIDKMDETGSDFGVVLYPIDCFDTDYKVWQSFKDLNVDSVLVGHDHEVSASVVYDGIRCQFGLKSTTYDSNIYIDENGKLVKSWIPAGTPMIGGTVMELNPSDGTMENVYHYYCKEVDFEM